MFHFNLQVYIFNSIQSPFPLYCYLLYFLWLFSKCWPDNAIVNALSGLTDKIVWVAMPLQPVLWFMAIMVHHPSLLYTLLITTDSTFCEFCLSFQPWYYIKASPSLNQSFINLIDRFRSHRSPITIFKYPYFRMLILHGFITQDDKKQTPNNALNQC